MEYLTKCKDFYKDFLFNRFGTPFGATSIEVDSFEDELGFKLPKAYREFLLWMGKDYLGPFRGSDWFLSNVLENTSYLPDLLTENGLHLELAEAPLAFFCHQGYMISWFALGESDDDPVCFFFSESCPKEIERVPSFSEFLLIELKTVAQIPGQPQLFL